MSDASLVSHIVKTYVETCVKPQAYARYPWISLYLHDNENNFSCAISHFILVNKLIRLCFLEYMVKKRYQKKGFPTVE